MILDFCKFRRTASKGKSCLEYDLIKNALEEKIKEACKAGAPYLMIICYSNCILSNPKDVISVAKKMGFNAKKEEGDIHSMSPADRVTISGWN